MFSLTLVDLEYDPSISIWELEMMIVENNSFANIYHVTRKNSQNRNETEFISVL